MLPQVEVGVLTITRLPSTIGETVRPPCVVKGENSSVIERSHSFLPSRFGPRQSGQSGIAEGLSAAMSSAANASSGKPIHLVRICLIINHLTTRNAGLPACLWSDGRAFRPWIGPSFVHERAGREAC